MAEIFGRTTVMHLVLLLLLFKIACSHAVESDRHNEFCRAKAALSHSIDTTKAFAVVKPEFLSFAFHAKSFARKSLEFMNAKFMSLCRGLSQQKGADSHVYLRSAGNSANQIHFKTEERYVQDVDLTHKSFLMTPERWDRMEDFVTKLGWKLIFGLNALPRRKDGSWDYDNSLELMSYVRHRGYLVDFELGNEPDLYHEKNITLNASQVASDFALLHNLTSKFMPGSKVNGPDLSHYLDNLYFKRFLEAVKPDVLDAFTWHFYYGAGATFSLPMFTDPAVLDKFLSVTVNVQRLVREAHGTKECPLWLGETADSYGGGVPELSSSYASGFTFVDKLGLAAMLNVSILFRQSIIGSHYALIDRTNDDFPRPCYWISSIYKILVGNKVLEVAESLKYNRTVRVYSHCINEDGRHDYGKGAIVLMTLNLNADSVKLELDGPLKDLKVHQFLLEPLHNDLMSQNVTLNGKLLEMIDDVTMPSYEPKVISQPFVLPPKRYGFFVIPDANAKACI